MADIEEIPSHQEASRRREKVALLIFFALLLVGGAILISYFSTGRNWSVAATFVDDRVGRLEDYSVIVFSGSAEPQYAANGNRKNASGIDEGSTMQTVYETQSDKSLRSDVYAVIMDAYHRVEKLQTTTPERVYSSDVRDLYELKGAHALTLNVADLAYYSHPTILSTGGKRFGVFSISSYTSRAQLKSIIAKLKDMGAKSIICVAPRMAMLSSCEGINVVILTDGESAATSYIRNNPGGDTLIVGSPEKGCAGVVIFSSNNVPSFKAIEKL